MFLLGGLSVLVIPGGVASAHALAGSHLHFTLDGLLPWPTGVRAVVRKVKPFVMP